MGSLISCTPTPQSSLSQTDYILRESEAVNGWFDDRFKDKLARSPMSQTTLGLKTNLGRLDDSSQQALDEEAALLRGWQQDLSTTFDPDRLDTQTRLSYDLYLYDAQDRLRSYAFADHAYIFQHMSGPHTRLPAFLINQHPITNRKDAESFIKRLSAAQTYLGHYAQRAQKQAENGVLLPRSIYSKLIIACQNIMTGQPFTPDGDSPLYAYFVEKIDALDIDPIEKKALKNSAQEQMINVVAPAYSNLINMFQLHQILSEDQDGVWKLPRGDAFYTSRLKHYTTTDMSADEIHTIGLKEVARIKDEMRGLMTDIGYDGTVQDFFTHLRTDPKFIYPNNAAGRQRYIQEASAYIDAVRGQLGGLFISTPSAELLVKRVEPFREASAFGAFYNQPALDKSRPGTYYINLKDMRELPTYQMQALAYHEGIPGHHMQFSVGMEQIGLPKFRTLGTHTAFTEGWALYAESLPLELGLYTDPYQNFGRLSMEIFRAARLVVDTGIHAKKWTRQDAIDYMLENTANAAGDVSAEVDRYIVWPGQATAYTIGMLKIKQLRARAQSELGDGFDLAQFHDLILANGSLPLSILEQQVSNWIETQKG